MQLSRLTQLINEHYKEGTEEKRILQFTIYNNEYIILYSGGEYHVGNIIENDNSIHINLFMRNMNYINLKSFLCNYYKIMEKELNNKK